MTFLNMDAMSVASNCSIIYYTPLKGGGGIFFFFKLEGCALKVAPPPRGSRNIPGGHRLGTRKSGIS